jgi:predicted DNA-binding protein
MPPSRARKEVGSLSIRLPIRLKDRAAEVAQSQEVSFNTFVTRLIEKAVKEKEDQELYDAFSELGSDLEISDVEFAFHAQAEVILSD